MQVLFPMDEGRKQKEAKEGAVTQGAEFSRGELKKACKGLQAGKAPGLDGIPNEIFKRVVEI